MTKFLDLCAPRRLAAALIILAAQPVFAEPGHIADDVYTYYHSGPGNQYRISGRVRSGESVEILNRDNNTNYVQIRTENGHTGWVPGDNVDNGESTLARLPALEKALNEKQATASTQVEEIQNLRSKVNELQTQNSTYTGKLDALNSKISTLNRQIDNMDESNLMRWFTHGGLVALGGVLLGLLIPYFPKRRKRRSDWF